MRDCHCGPQRVSGPAAVSEQTTTPLQNTGAAIAMPPGEYSPREGAMPERWPSQSSTAGSPQSTTRRFADSRERLRGVA